MKRILVIAGLMLLAALVVVALLAGRRPAAPWFSAVSQGNGYDLLLRAAGQINGGVPEGKTEIAAFVKENEGMFETVRSALKVPFEVPAMNYAVASSLPADMSSFKTIALALRARGREAEERGAKGEAMTNYVGVIQLGQRVEHGPIIAMLVGVAIEKIGLDALEKLALDFQAAQRKEIADKIQSLDRERLAFAEVLRREEYFARQVAGNPLKLLVARFYMKSALVKAEQKHDKISSDFQRVAKELRSGEDEKR
jgi:hypothetical protein